MALLPPVESLAYVILTHGLSIAASSCGSEVVHPVPALETGRSLLSCRLCGRTPRLLDSRTMDFTPQQAEFLSQPHICVMATADAAGTPHAVPVWYLCERDTVVVMIGKGSKKHRNLIENPQVSLAFDQRSPPYYALMVNGPVRLEGDASYDDILRIAVKYLGEEEGETYADSMDPSDIVLVKLESGRVVEHMAS